MKRSALFALMCMLTIMSNAQIALDHTFPTMSASNFPSLVTLEANGQKWLIEDYLNNKFHLYNLDYTLFKTITIPAQPANFYVTYVSDKLFDTDEAIEYVLNNSNHTRVIIYKEDGSVVFSAGDNLANASMANNWLGTIYNTAQGTKMEIAFTSTTTYSTTCNMYSLPGILVDIPATQSKTNPERNVVQVFPNPSNGNSRIEYHLLPDETEGQLSFYNLQGNHIKSFNVKGQTGSIEINNTNLPAGTYLFKLNTGRSSSEVRRMILIK